MPRLAGFVTKLKFVAGRASGELELTLGYRTGRLREGWDLYALTAIPKPDEFIFAGYSYMSGGVPQGHLRSTTDRRSADQRLADMGVDVDKLKRKQGPSIFSLTGADRIVKVAPRRGTFGEEDYPPGKGVPQWILTKPQPFVHLGAFAADEVYRADAA